MSKLKVLVGNNFQELFNESIKHIGPFLHDYSKENIIIVPDKLSMLTEQKIFEILNISVYFNISVMGISQFATKIINSNGLNFMECNKLQSKLLTLRSIQNVKQNFKCFSKNCNLGLADEIYSKIEQIKSSRTNIDDLIDENASFGTKLKFEDIKLIYNEYEKLRGNKLDSADLLSLFNNICSTSQIIKQCNVFFLGFDSMTRQGIEVIKNTTKNAHMCFVSVLSPNNQPNEKIYDQTYLNSIINLCKENNIEGEFKWIAKNNKNTTKNIILNNIFCRKLKFNKNDYINIYKSVNINEEIDFVVKSINFNIKTKNAYFKDFAICAPENMSHKINFKLQALGISTHLDTKATLISLEPIKYLLNWLKYSLESDEKTHLLQIIQNDFFEISKENKEILINLIYQYSSINSIKNYCKDLNEETLDILNNLSPFEIKDNDIVSNYIKNIENIIKNIKFYEKISNFCELLENINEINLQKTYLQINKKLKLIFENLQNAIPNTSLTFSEFIEIFENALKECEISGIPSTVNEVFIGNSKSFYGNVKYLYIVGATEGVFPELLTDNGLISDKEISSPTIKAVLEPTTSIVNKRNKLNAITILLSASEKCYLSYHMLDADQKNTQPCELISELKYLLGLKDINVSNFGIYDDHCLDVSKLCFNNLNVYNTNLNANLEDNPAVVEILNKTLMANENKYKIHTPQSEDANFNKLFFENGKVSISLIEKYNSCPKSAFLSNGIKLKKQNRDKIESNIIGTFIHEIAELFIKQNQNKLGSFNELEIKKIVQSLCLKIINKEKYFSLALNENKFIYNLLVKECIRFCTFINHEQTISQFKPTYTEKYFGETKSFKPIVINIDKELYKISGIIDRIDFYDNYFRIIDYKSGNVNFKSLKDGLFYGTKLQLFIYAEAVNQNINKKLFGAFYLPISNSFSPQNANDYSYNGFFINSVALAQKCDNTLSAENRESKLLGCTLNKPQKDGSMNFRKSDNIISQEQLECFRKYAIKIVTQAIKNMKKGHIVASPFKDKCTYCEFKNVCNFFDKNNYSREANYTLTNDTFLEFKYEQ